jgi:hypothetical protein
VNVTKARFELTNEPQAFMRGFSYDEDMSLREDVGEKRPPQAGQVYLLACWTVRSNPNGVRIEVDDVILRLADGKDVSALGQWPRGGGWMGGLQIYLEPGALRLLFVVDRKAIEGATVEFCGREYTLGPAVPEQASPTPSR